MQRRGSPRRASRLPVTDRWSFKPVALLLLLAVVAATGALVAVVLAPPFVGAGLAVKELGRRLDAVGADFTKIPRPPQRSTIYASDGTTVLSRIYLDNREIVPLKQVAPVARRAVLAIEDSSFYEHGGLNPSSLLRAMLENLQAGAVVQGGSTITQQLVKLTLEVDPLDKSFERKFQEAALAMKVEQRYPKDRILAMYLNEVFLGNNVYGIGTASEFYFNKPASELNLNEAALLAGMIRAPAYYDPLQRPDVALLRRNDVLNRMMALGPSWLPRARGEKAKARPIRLAPKVGQVAVKQPPFIAGYVKQQIIEDPHGWYGVLGATPKERAKKLSEGGLGIVTTLEPNWFEAAQRAANQPWARTPYHPDHDPPADVGIVSVDVPTGAIKMMLSGKHFQQDRVDTVTTAHQPGSSFKPYVLAAAFEQGIAPTASYSGAQGAIDDPRCETKGEPWIVYNAEGTSRGSLDLYTATAESVNAVFARLILDAGPQNVVDVAHKMGVESPLPAVCALATGSVGVSPLDQASGFQTLANQGVHCIPYSVQEIWQGDQLIFRARPDCERAIPRPTANLITDMLRGVVTHGTASSAFSGWGPWPIVGKTGTAQDNEAVWFCGYTRQVATAVWVGSQGRPYPLSEYWGYDVFGGSTAAPIWRAYMAQVMKGQPALNFETPQLVTVPNVVGKSQADATALLKQAGFGVTTATVGSYLPAGTVAEQNPAGGSQTIDGATVQLGVSNGVAPVSVVPKVKGMSVGEATAALRAAHFLVNAVERAVTDPALEGIVWNQSPAGGASLAEGSTVTIFVGVLQAGGGNGGGGGAGGGNGGGG